MKIESKDFKIKNIFSRRTYKIPDYQRNYSWTVSEEISIFWDDFIYYLEEGKHSNFFIGSMVFKGDGINAGEFEVIDGQQRLITFSVLLSVVVKLFRKYGRDDLSKGLKQYLIYMDEKSQEQLVINTIEPHPFFQRKIFHEEEGVKPIKPSEKLIELARYFFEDSIEKMLLRKPREKKIEFLEKIRDFIFDIDTVIIVSDNEADAFTIFETINTRGKDLSSLDLLKNYIFKNYPCVAGVNEPKETWKIISANIKLGAETFFNRFWASWVSKVTENKLYRRFHDHMRSSAEFKDTKILLNELLVSSEIYKKIGKPTLDDWKVNKNYQIYYHLKNINGLFNLRVHYPFFLALFEEFDKKTLNLELLKKVLLMMENFHFIFTHIVSSRASGFDNKYSKFAIRLREEKDKSAVIEDLKKELTQKLPKKDEYFQSFKELNFIDNKETIKFVLLRLEKEVNHNIFIDLEENSIEHLLPKSVRTAGSENVGNLFLLEQQFNERKDNLKPFEKFDATRNSLEFLIDSTKYSTSKSKFKKILSIGIWSENEIKNRAQLLAEKTYSLFSKF